jgi:hypothetical protein
MSRNQVHWNLKDSAFKNNKDYKKNNYTIIDALFVLMQVPVGTVFTPRLVVGGGATMARQFLDSFLDFRINVATGHLLYPPKSSPRPLFPPTAI